MARVLDWQLRDVLLAYLAWLRRQASTEFKHSQVVWALIAPHVKKPPTQPKLPAILEGDHG